MVALAHERFDPADLLQQAVEAEQAGFDGVCCSDHLAPWWTAETDPAEIYRRAEDEVKDQTFTKQIVASSDPEQHVKRIKLIEKLGATTIVAMNVSGNDPHGALRVYGERVLPALRAR